MADFIALAFAFFKATAAFLILLFAWYYLAVALGNRTLDRNRNNKED